MARQYHSAVLALSSNKTKAKYAFLGSSFRSKRPEIVSIRYTISDEAQEIHNGFNTAFTAGIPVTVSQQLLLINEHFQVVTANPPTSDTIHVLHALEGQNSSQGKT
jgi:hypothetical protein